MNCILGSICHTQRLWRVNSVKSQNSPEPKKDFSVWFIAQNSSWGLLNDRAFTIDLKCSQSKILMVMMNVISSLHFYSHKKSYSTRLGHLSAWKFQICLYANEHTTNSQQRPVQTSSKWQLLSHEYILMYFKSVRNSLIICQYCEWLTRHTWQRPATFTVINPS